MLLVSLLACFACVPAVAVAQPAKDHGKPGVGKRLILQPRPDQRIKTHRVRIVVRSGPERFDLKAKLNGVKIGSRFKVKLQKRQRVLDATLVDGLRRGRNVLHVSVRGRHGYRHRTIRFFVVHHKPLTSAGTVRRVLAGTPLRLQGMIKLDRSDKGKRRVHWDLVGAPRRSAMHKLIDVAGRAGPQQSALSGSRTLTPTIKPDVPGSYKLRLTTSSENGTTEAWTTIYAVKWPLMVLETEVPPAAGEATPQPGIQLGGELLRAPFMRVANGKGTYWGEAESINYQAMWQLVALQRTTAAIKWNRTYGVCEKKGSFEAYICYQGANGFPSRAELANELSALGPDSLVIAASHPSSDVPSAQWGLPNNYEFVGKQLGVIGLPGKSDPTFGQEIETAGPGEMAAVGVPGLKPGEAKFIVGAGGGLDGYLGFDSSENYTYIPKQREPFATRASTSSCNGTSCTVVQKVGGSEVSGSINAFQAGYLVSGWDRHTLAPIAHETFVTASGHSEPPGGAGEKATEEMVGEINYLRGKKALVLISSIHGPNQSVAVTYTPSVSAEKWQSLTGEITALGGTRERFNVAATTPGSDYTLVGHEGQAEDEGLETIGAGAHLSGGLVPSDQSLYEPIGVSSGDAPPEFLINLVLQPPKHTGWPLEGGSEAEKEAELALSFIGGLVPQLGPNPRSAYWTRLDTAGKALEAQVAVTDKKVSEIPSNAPFSKFAFEEARGELAEELGMVAKTRRYLAELGAPAGPGLAGWEQATTLGEELERELEVLKAEGEVNAEWFSGVQGLLELLALAAGVGEFDAAPQLEKFLAGSAIAAGTGQTLWNADYEGGSISSGVRVKAHELAKKLAEQGHENEAAFQRMGDIIVSDWEKLKIVGKYAECDLEGDGCGPHEEFAELTWDKSLAEEAKETMQRAYDRVIYEQLVPIAFPIWDTGAMQVPEAAGPVSPYYFCVLDVQARYPLEHAPQLSYLKSLQEFNPQEGVKKWEFYVSIARSGEIYSFPSEKILNRMFGKLPENDLKAADGGLQMDPGQFMRTGIKINRYSTIVQCEWLKPPAP